MIKIEVYDQDGDSFAKNEFSIVVTVNNHRIPIRKIQRELLENIELLTKYISERIKGIAQLN